MTGTIQGFHFRERPGYVRARRVFDTVFATCALIASAPLLCVAAMVIVLESPGSPLFVQKRVGRFGRLFDLYKLRTMRSDMCGDALSPTASGDPRITRSGKWLRKLSIDELPQFYNILIGDMTLVGPRPEMPFLVRRYAPWQSLRHLVTPGITGLWQVECRSTIPLQSPEATALDLKYIQQASPLTDWLIILRTVRAIVVQRGAY